MERIQKFGDNGEQSKGYKEKKEATWKIVLLFFDFIFFSNENDIK
jgi:hypothetical protein